MQYVAFLRGINVGGNTKVPMGDLKNVFESLGSTQVETVLNSGNVAFEHKEKSSFVLTKDIEEKLEKTFGFYIRVIVRSREEIGALVVSEPFKDIRITPQTRLYITFLSTPTTYTLSIPYHSPERDFSILSVDGGNIVSVLELSSEKNTTDAMKILGKEFGKDVTTRNWNTVLKIYALLFPTKR